MPERIQLRRTKGWRMPVNTVKVDRATTWGNPYQLLYSYPAKWFPAELVESLGCKVSQTEHGPFVHVRTNPQAVGLFRWWVNQDDEKQAAFREILVAKLRGKNLACWCGEGEPCHADVLLEIANSEKR